MKTENTENYKEEFMEYYEHYQDDIFRFCMVKLKNRQESLDITQDTFMKLWEHMSKGKEVSQERALLYKIANNLIIDFYRKKKSIQVDDYTEAGYASELITDDRERMIDKLDGERLIPILEELPETIREIIKLRLLQDFSISEIAEFTGKNNKTVSVYLHRGIKQLRSILENYE